MSKQVDIVNQSAEADPDQVFDAIHAVMHLFRDRRRGDDGATGDLPHMERKALGFFARNPGATQSDLVAHSGRDKGQIARLIASLRERGLLDAKADAADRRSLRLQLTGKALAVHRAAQLEAHRVAASAVEGLSDRERRQLLSLLQRVRANLEAED